MAKKDLVMRQKRTSAEQDYPLVSVIRIKYQSLKCDVDVRQLDTMSEYITYVEQVGGDKPTPGEVVGAALEHLFRLDVGFQKWQEQSRPQAAGDRTDHDG